MTGVVGNEIPHITNVALWVQFAHGQSVRKGGGATRFSPIILGSAGLSNFDHQEREIQNSCSGPILTSVGVLLLGSNTLWVFFFNFWFQTVGEEEYLYIYPFT